VCDIRKAKARRNRGWRRSAIISENTAKGSRNGETCGVPSQYIGEWLSLVEHLVRDTVEKG